MKICPLCKAEYESGEVFCPVDGARLASPSQLAAPTDSSDPLVGTTLGERYKIIRQIGEGGMGIVYEAEHIVIEKRVALKVLRDDFSKRPEVVERFRQEAKSASRIGHQHIVDISDFGETPRGQSYFVMEFLEGEDLANVLGREGTVSPDRVVRIAIQCCKALGAAHAKGIVHRDMKPENIFLVNRTDQEDFVKIVDFGIAKMSDIETDGAPGRKLTKTGMIFGTPEYMSPEQAAGKPLDHRVDIYAVGVILYECITGRVPFVGDTFMGILTQHMFEEPPPLAVANPHARCAPALEEVIFHALEKDPDARYGSMEEFGRALARATDASGPFVPADHTLSGYGEPVQPVRRGPRLVESEHAPTAEFPHAGRQSRAGLWMGAVAVLLVGGAVAGYFALRPDTTEASGPEMAAQTGEGASAEPDEPGEGTPSDAPAAADEAGSEVLAGRGDVAGEAAGAQAAGEGTEEVAGEAPEMVSIEVVTRPAGAALEVDGRGTVCDETPCTFETPVGEGIRIRARRGRFVGVRDLEPEQAMAVDMRLLRRSGRPRRADGPSEMDRAPAGGDLKIPDIFR